MFCPNEVTPGGLLDGGVWCLVTRRTGCDEKLIAFSPAPHSSEKGESLEMELMIMPT